MGDFLFNITEWLRTTPLSGFALGMSEWPLTLWIVTHFWAIPFLQIVHILAIAGSFASVLMISMRVFGLAGHATLAETSRRYTKVLWWSLVFIVLSGILMLFGDTVRNLLNAIFWIKMILVVLAIVSSIAFAKSLSRQLTTGDVVGGGTKATSLFLIVLWCVIMTCGRWIAYAPV
ncbi:MAG: hypothetical protein ABIT16_12065 [Croceibacterium sp.]